MWGWKVWGKGRDVVEWKNVSNSCLVIWEGEFRREMERDQQGTLYVKKL